MHPVGPTRVRYLVLAWYCLLATLAYIHRGCLSVDPNRIARELHIDPDDMDFILGMFFWGYAAMQVPSGWIAWRWGSRLVVPILILIWSGSNALTGLAIGFWFLLTWRFVMGMTQAGLFPCAVQSFARWFPPSQRAMPSGYLAAAMSVGGVLSLALTGALLNVFSWSELMLIYALPGLVGAFWFYSWFRDDPRERPGVNAEELALLDANGPSTGVAMTQQQCDAWQRVILTPNVLWICLQQFCRAAAYIFYMTWWPRFLQESRGMDVSTSGYIGGLPLIGVVVGSAFGGQLMDWVYRRTGSLGWSRRGLAMAHLLASAFFMFLGYLVEDVWATVTFLTVSSIFAGACGPASYTATIDLGRGHIATVFSIMNMAGNIGAALLPSLAIAIKQEGGWDDVLLLLAALYVLAAACWVLVRLPARTPPGT